MRSNCIVWALWTYACRLRDWTRAGMPREREPYLLIRPSRYRPRWVPHVLVGQRGRAGRMELLSYKPTSGADVPWYLAWLRLLFKGQAEAGDWQDTVAQPPSH